MHVPIVREIRPLTTTTWRASADLPTKHGMFKMHVFAESVPSHPFREPQPVREHVAMVFGDVRGARVLAVRVHSECLTSEVFGSLKCDCREQLEAALAEVARRGAGIVLYLRQEGRGIGLINKVRAYDLQSRGHDTVDANRLLGLPDDSRDYTCAKVMLDYLGVESIQLLTNNPDKVAKLTALGVQIESRQGVLIEPNMHSRGYLEAKRIRMAHVLPEWSKQAPANAE